jgi:hypothetical protein
MLLAICQYIHLCQNRQFCRFIFTNGSKTRVSSFLVVLCFQKVVETFPGCFLVGGFFFLGLSSVYGGPQLHFKVVICSGDGRKSQGLPYKNAVLELSFERLFGDLWSQFLFFDPRMARRTLFDMGASCHFDAFISISEVKLGNMQNVTVGRQMGQIG